MANYSDKYLSIDGGVLTIRWYFFPAGTKRITLSDVHSCEEHTMSGLMSGKSRIWGGSPTHWFNLDPARPSKSAMFALDVGGGTKPSLTPDDPDAFRAALTEAGTFAFQAPVPIPC